MKKKRFSSRIATDDSKENAFVEIHYDGDQWAEISYEKKEPMIAFFSPTDKEYWEFDYYEAIRALQSAKNSY